MNTEVSTPSHHRVILSFSSFDPVRDHSPEYVNIRVAYEMEKSVEEYSRQNKIMMSHRLYDLDHEWDLDRALVLSLALMGVSALLLGTRKNNKSWLSVAASQFAFLIQHTVSGWCPHASVLRRLGLRSYREIEAEKYALKTVRGDFDQQMLEAA